MVVVAVVAAEAAVVSLALLTSKYISIRVNVSVRLL